MGKTPLNLAAGLTIAGAITAVAGVALIYPPAALILGGCLLVAAGLFSEVG